MNGNAEHAVEHEELLSAVLAGELAHESPDFQRRIAECPECRARWERVRPIAARLAEAGAEERRALSSALAGGAAPGEDGIDATVARLVRSEPWRSARPRRWTWLAAAALLMVLGTWWYESTDSERAPPGADVPLGDRDEHLRLIAPVGKVATFERFLWQYDGRDAAFLLILHEESETGERRKLREISCGGDTEWKPDFELPARIFWEVVVLDEFGVPLSGSPRSASAWR